MAQPSSPYYTPNSYSPQKSYSNNIQPNQISPQFRYLYQNNNSKDKQYLHQLYPQNKGVSQSLDLSYPQLVQSQIIKQNIDSYNNFTTFDNVRNSNHSHNHVIHNSGIKFNNCYSNNNGQSSSHSMSSSSHNSSQLSIRNQQLGLRNQQLGLRNQQVSNINRSSKLSKLTNFMKKASVPLLQQSSPKAQIITFKQMQQRLNKLVKKYPIPQQDNISFEYINTGSQSTEPDMYQCKLKENNQKILDQKNHFQIIDQSNKLIQSLTKNRQQNQSKIKFHQTVINSNHLNQSNSNQSNKSNQNQIKYVQGYQSHAYSSNQPNFNILTPVKQNYFLKSQFLLQNKVQTLEVEKKQLHDKIEWLNKIIQQMLNKSTDIMASKSSKNKHQITQFAQVSLQTSIIQPQKKTSVIQPHKNPLIQQDKRNPLLQPHKIIPTKGPIIESLRQQISYKNLYQKCIKQNNELLDQISQISTLQQVYQSQFKLILSQIKLIKQYHFDHYKKIHQQKSRQKSRKGSKDNINNQNYQFNNNYPNRHNQHNQYQQNQQNINQHNHIQLNQIQHNQYQNNKIQQVLHKRLFEDKIIYQLKNQNTQLNDKYLRLKIKYYNLKEQMTTNNKQNTFQYVQNQKYLNRPPQIYYNQSNRSQSQCSLSSSANFNLVYDHIKGNLVQNNKHNQINRTSNKINAFRQNILDRNKNFSQFKQYKYKHKDSQSSNSTNTKQIINQGYNRYNHFIKSLKQRFSINSSVIQPNKN